jgi:hypothetical protein
MRYVAMVAVLGLVAASASAGVGVGGTDSFTNGVNGGADWGVGGTDGWSSFWEARGATTGQNTHAEYFGSTGVIETPALGGQSNPTRGQPDPGSKSGSPGTLVMQHLASWNDGGDYTMASKQMVYITFPSVAGVSYSVSGWVNTVKALNPGEGIWTDPYPASNLFGGHPRTVQSMASWFADIAIGLKLGAPGQADLDATANTANFQTVTGLVDTLGGGGGGAAWVQSPTATLVGDGGPMTIMLRVRAADTSAGARSDLDVRWDDITLTPEPSVLALLSLGLLFIRRR